MVKKLYNFIRIIIFGIFYFIKGSILFADELQDISLTDDTLKATINQETYEFDVLSNDDFVPPDSEIVILQKNPKCGEFQINENKIIYILNNTCNEEFEEKIIYSLKGWEDFDNATANFIFEKLEELQNEEDIEENNEEEIANEIEENNVEEQGIENDNETTEVCNTILKTDKFVIDYGETKSLNVLENDKICDGDIRDINLDVEPSCGSIDILSDFNIKFTPDMNCPENVVFTYQLINYDELVGTVQLKINEFECPQSDFGKLITIPAQEFNAEDINNQDFYFTYLLSEVARKNLDEGSNITFSNKPFCILSSKIHAKMIPDEILDYDEINFESCNYFAKNDKYSAKGFSPDLAFETVEDYFIQSGWLISVPTLEDYIAASYHIEKNGTNEDEDEKFLLSFTQGVKEISSSFCSHNGSNLILGSNCNNQNFRGYCVDAEKTPTDFGFRIKLNR